MGRHLEAGQYVAQSGLHLHQCEPISCGNIKRNDYELRSHVNADSVFKLSFLVNNTLLKSKFSHTFK